MRKPGLWLVLLACAFFAACAHDLSGTWGVYWPDGKLARVTIQNFGDGQWYLKSGVAELSGIYVYRNSQLISAQPDLPVMAGFVWRESKDESFTMTQQPEASRLHDHWLGARMVRIDSD